MQMHLMYVLRHFVLLQHLILLSGWWDIEYPVFFTLSIIYKCWTCLWKYQGVLSFHQIIERASCSDGSCCVFVLVNSCLIIAQLTPGSAWKWARGGSILGEEKSSDEVFSSSFESLFIIYQRCPADKRFACWDLCENMYLLQIQIHKVTSPVNDCIIFGLVWLSRWLKLSYRQFVMVC